MHYTDNILHLDSDILNNICNASSNNQNIATEHIWIITDATPFCKFLGNEFFKTMHQQVELITNGSVYCNIDGKTYNLHKGALLIYPKYSFISIKNTSEDFNSVCIDFDIKECFDSDFLNYMININTSDSFYTLLLDYFNLIYSTAKYDSSDYISLKRLVFSFLTIIRHYYLQNESSYKNILPNNRSNEIYYSFIKLLKDKSNDFTKTIQDYADLLCISKSHLQNTVKKVSGQSITTIINNELTDRICTMISNGIPAKIIMNEFHFRNMFEFSRFFKFQTGITPKEYRINLEKEPPF